MSSHYPVPSVDDTLGMLFGVLWAQQGRISRLEAELEALRRELGGQSRVAALQALAHASLRDRVRAVERARCCPLCRKNDGF